MTTDDRKRPAKSSRRKRKLKKSTAKLAPAVVVAPDKRGESPNHLRSRAKWFQRGR